ncbi:hypothetical protein Selin_0926 [Desulfurispirillum indicum S5]|uniref:Uncharacterized protein n=1 Tax=Desulfurispirillum indicum (strain ATCC BAA-1389 / DSM 22839 / S5) TaxID=653733 RepID=E6W305_DESIS|nr:hypothetical protein Selin_0926 [Desulfurispirillum indicum S5]
MFNQFFPLIEFIFASFQVSLELFDSGLVNGMIEPKRKFSGNGFLPSTCFSFQGKACIMFRSPGVKPE